MQRLAALLSLAGMIMVSPVVAQDNAESPVVVELFTSQGCSSCPPADALMHDLAGRDDVIPLALHVDYWDYIGWKDAFARADHTSRQKRYARAAGRRMIYTPQMVINGREAIVGAKAMKLFDTIAAEKNRPARAVVQMARQDNRLEISVSPGAGLPKGGYELHLIRYEAFLAVDIKRGENAGRHMEYANVVRDWQVLGDWNGQAALTVETDLQGALPVVVLVQGADAGPIVAAAVLE